MRFTKVFDRPRLKENSSQSTGRREDRRKSSTASRSSRSVSSYNPPTAEASSRSSSKVASSRAVNTSLLPPGSVSPGAASAYSNFLASTHKPFVTVPQPTREERVKTSVPVQPYQYPGSVTSQPRLPAHYDYLPTGGHYHLTNAAGTPAPTTSGSGGNGKDIRHPSPKHRQNLNQWYNRKGPQPEEVHDDPDETMESNESSEQQETSYETNDDEDDDDGSQFHRNNSSTEYSADGLIMERSMSRSIDEKLTEADLEDYFRTKQDTAYCSIVLTSVQLLILCLQLAMCGIATLDVNPLVGPYPDAFSEWGGKNVYLMMEKHQWFRLVTPSFLHVGILQLLANAFCQLEPIAFFEREWGSTRWLMLYVISSVGASVASSLLDPDTIGVGSSGALMGMFSAKLAQVLTHTLCDVSKNHDDFVRLDQLSSVVCGLVIVSLLSSFTYIDWSGHMGGLATGFWGGMFLFAGPIRGMMFRFLWALIGLAGLVGSFAWLFYTLFDTVEPEEELGDACEYFRYFFPEGYDCGCLW